MIGKLALSSFSSRGLDARISQPSHHTSYPTRVVHCWQRSQDNFPRSVLIYQTWILVPKTTGVAFFRESSLDRQSLHEILSLIFSFLYLSRHSWPKYFVSCIKHTGFIVEDLYTCFSYENQFSFFKKTALLRHNLYTISYPFKVNNPMIFSKDIELCNHRYDPVLGFSPSV